MVLKLNRPIVARIMTIPDWPLILVDLETEEGITGRSYIGPYNAGSIKYLLPVIRDFGTLFKGQPVAPADLYTNARKVAASAWGMPAYRWSRYRPSTWRPGTRWRRPQANRSVCFLAAALAAGAAPITATDYGSASLRRSRPKRLSFAITAASAV